MTLALRVLPTTPRTGASAHGATAPSELSDTAISAIAAELVQLDVGDVRFDAHTRALYATDASIYQVRPIGVVIPQATRQIPKLVAYCAQRRLAILPRGSGTSLAGQCTNHAVVVDLSAACRRFVDADVANRLCQVEPGITIEDVNRELATRRTGLFFAPDPATSAQATVGGCIGNNAAGARSIRYGRTSENIAALDVLLADGSRLWLGPGAGRDAGRALELARQVVSIVLPVARLIRLRFAKTIRRNAGYALDGILQQLDRGIGTEDLDLTGLICGSEGTLAIVLGARLKLQPVPVARGLAVVSYPTLEAALAAVPAIVATAPSAVELLDDVVLAAAERNTKTRAYLDVLGPTQSNHLGAVLYCEYEAAAGRDELDASFARLRSAVGDAAIVEYRDGTSMARAWALRTAGEPLLHGIAGRRKPLTFVEDNAVPVERLAEFIAAFKRIVADHGTTAAVYAHASVGVLHVRPLLDLHERADQAKLRSIALAVAELARSSGGVMSGEHGDGRVRGPLLEHFFGPELMHAFRQIKAVFDPQNLLNPGMIVAAGLPDSITNSLRTHERHHALADVDTFFDYGDQDGFGPAIERCNGAGVCRKMTGGTMCPSYRATRNERHSTRGRGNALREAIIARANQDAPDWDDPATIQTLDLCLSCKACKTECPSNVDLAKLKAEYTAQRYRDGGPPLSAWFFAHIRQFNRIASAFPPLASALTSFWPTRALLNAMLGLAPQRPLPKVHRSIWRQLGRRRTGCSADASRVVLFGDCFTAYQEPHIARAAVTVLEALGYEVQVVDAGCCGRAMISTGLLPDAIAAAERSLAILLPLVTDERCRALIVCEPSCLSAIADDWLQLRLDVPLAQRKALAAKAMQVEHFVETAWDAHPRRPDLAPAQRQILLHAHCHQKALWGDETSAAPLRRCASVTTIDAGCCGMAGSFGYQADKYDLSMQIGNLALFPALNAAPADTTIAAPGTSCREQIRHGTGRIAQHPIELLAEAIKAG